MTAQENKKNLVRELILISLLLLICCSTILTTKAKVEKNNLSDNSSNQLDFYAEMSSNKITMQHLKKYKSFENLSELEAEEIIDSLYNLSLITLNIYKNESR